MHRGFKKNQNYTWLICAAPNMENISIKKENVNGRPLINLLIKEIILKITKFKVKYC
ncbi:MAG: hypothetical protein PHS24_02295 [Bacilli bacterium]|nr:hypothetical protein [Bacilli bacterium]